MRQKRDTVQSEARGHGIHFCIYQLDTGEIVMHWRPGDTAPKDGSRIWAWLYDGGIHLMTWMSAQANAEAAGEPDKANEYISCWVKAAAPDDGDWNVKHWLPEEAISVPPAVVFVPEINRWRDMEKLKVRPADAR